MFCDLGMREVHSIFAEKCSADCGARMRHRILWGALACGANRIRGGHGVLWPWRAATGAASATPAVAPGRRQRRPRCGRQLWWRSQRQRTYFIKWWIRAETARGQSGNAIRKQRIHDSRQQRGLAKGTADARRGAHPRGRGPVVIVRAWATPACRRAAAITRKRGVYGHEDRRRPCQLLSGQATPTTYSIFTPSPWTPSARLPWWCGATERG